MSVLIRVFKHRRLLEAFDDERRVLSCRVSLDVYKRQVYRQFRDIQTFMDELSKLLRDGEG